MRYLIKERIFSFADRFTINDESNRPQYEVVGKIFAIGNKLNFYDIRGKHILYIEQKIFRLLPEYSIYEDGRVSGKVYKELTLFKPKFTIDSVYGSFTIEGSVLKHDFNILKNGRPIAYINKKWISFSDTYSVEINDEENHAFILALIIVLDQIYYDNRNKG